MLKNGFMNSITEQVEVEVWYNSDLSYLDISNINFNEVGLRNLSECNLAYTTFKNCNLEGVSFGKFFDSTRFKNCNLSHTIMPHSIDYTDFYGCNLYRSSFSCADFASVTFRDCDLNYASFDRVGVNPEFNLEIYDSNLQFTDFYRCELENATIQNCDFTNADFTDGLINHCSILDTTLKGVLHKELSIYQSRINSPERIYKKIFK